MFPLLSSLRGLLKIQNLTTDNYIFRLHYRFTVGTLALFSVLLTFKQFLGDPIACTENPSQNSPRHVVEPFCWTHHTFSIKEAFEDKDAIYPGVARTGNREKVEHKYYQWVCFVLALQALMFYIPRYLWKSLEAERVKNLVMGLDTPVLEQEEVNKKQELIVRYFKTHWGTHTSYAVKYAICECLNLINVIGQMYLLNAFFGGEFSKFGTRVIQYANGDPRERVDPMIKIFPRMTKCHFFHGGATGDTNFDDFLCILPLNVINEKIFIFIWFWFVLLLAVTAAGILYRAVIFLWPTMRNFMLKFRNPMSDSNDIQKLSLCAPLGDWFLLYQLAKNVEPFYMLDIIHHIADDVDAGKTAWLPEKITNKNAFADELV